MTGPLRRLLLVDDERAVLDGLKKALRPWREQWSVVTALGGAAAYEALAGDPFDAVVSDARMPEIDGEAVMRRAAEAQPTAVRVVLSGQVDARTGHRLAALCHQFLSKPSSAQALMTAVEECQRLSASLGSASLRALVGRLQGLPVAPRVYHRISSLVDDPTAPTQSVADELASDPGLVTRLLRSVNSAAFGLSRKVGTVNEAVTLLGLERVREVVLMVELFDSGAPEGVLEELRDRAVRRSKLARLLGGGLATVDLAAESALLVDSGALALACAAPQAYASLWHRAGDRRERERAEHAEFGASSVEVGAVLLGLWGMPSAVVNAVRWSGDRPPPEAQADARTLTSLCVQLEDEVEGSVSPRESEALAEQLGVAGRLGAARELVAQHKAAA